MTETIKNKIIVMRKEGKGYRVIAAELELDIGTVRDYCRSCGLAGYSNAAKLNYMQMGANGLICPVCGKPMKVSKRGRPKKFCSDKCRLQHWKDNGNAHTVICAGCGIEFIGYGKYCSHECYIKSRFGGKEDDRTH